MNEYPGSYLTLTADTIYAPKFRCPLHGDISEVVSSGIKDHNGNWCMICLIELLDKHVLRVQKIDD